MHKWLYISRRGSAPLAHACWCPWWVPRLYGLDGRTIGVLCLYVVWNVYVDAGGFTFKCSDHDFTPQCRSWQLGRCVTALRKWGGGWFPKTNMLTKPKLWWRKQNLLFPMKRCIIGYNVSDSTMFGLQNLPRVFRQCFDFPPELQKN